MILNWSDLKEKHPLAVQTIRQATGFAYEPAYGNLFKDGKVITYADIEGFFDDQGWLLTIYPVDFPRWNGIITDATGKQVFNDQDAFELVKSRNHAKSLLAGVAVMFFEDVLKTMLDTNKSTLRLKYTDLNEQGKDKILEFVEIEDLTIDARGLMSIHDFVVIDLHDSQSKFLKSTISFPFAGLTFNTSDFPVKQETN